MNYNKNVVVFTLVATFILFLYSLFTAAYPSFSFNLDNISIVSDILLRKPAEPVASPVAIKEIPVKDSLFIPETAPLLQKTLNKYQQPKAITAFNNDTNCPALPGVMKKLYTLKHGKKRKVRIAWLGDSIIEGDLLTQTFRKRIQQYFGGFGVGFIPATSVSAAFRTSVSHKWTGDWNEENFKTKALSGSLFLSGHLFYTANGEIHLTDLTAKDTSQLLEKSLICGNISGDVSITVNGQPKQFAPGKRINRLLLDNSKSKVVEVTVQNNKLPVYGVSMEPVSGVIVDNFSFRGITGLELGKLDTNLLKDIQQENPYDLVILEYGANLMFRPDDSDYSWFQKHIIPVVKKLRIAMPNTEFLIISTSDRAFRYGEAWKTAVGINNLVRNQAELALGSGAAFFNMYASMGGAGTIVRWVDSTTPTLANKDYIHPNQRGAELLGNMFFDAFMKDYDKVTQPPTQDDNYTITTANTIIDKKTSLEWYMGAQEATWAGADNWAKSLTIANAAWALPTGEQVLTLYNTKYSAGIGYEHEGVFYMAKINAAFNIIGNAAWVWTNESIDDNKAWAVNLNQGKKITANKNTVSYPIKALAVRKISEPAN